MIGEKERVIGEERKMRVEKDVLLREIRKKCEDMQ